MQTNITPILANILQRTPCASAVISGSAEYPTIHGEMRFYPYRGKTLLTVSLGGLPETPKHRIFALHIHEGGSCTGKGEDPFSDAGQHYNPHHFPHPQHAGDLPPVFANGATAWYAFLTDRFTCREILGKTVILHEKPDDFITQPSGNAGKKIACGVIHPVRNLYRF